MAPVAPVKTPTHPFEALWPAPIRHNQTNSLLWPGLVIVSALLGSIVFSCITPFVAYALVGARTLPLRTALGAVAGVWLINQAAGFGLLGYPQTTDAVLWGLTIAVAALGATVAAAGAMRTSARLANFASSALALIAAFAVYEGILFAAAQWLGGTGAYSGAIVARIAVINLLWTVGLIAAYTSLVRYGPQARRYR